MRSGRHILSLLMLLATPQCTTQNLRPSMGGGGGGGGGTGDVEDALEQLGADLQAGAPVLGELERALVVRMSSDNATVIAAQYLHMSEAIMRHEPLRVDPAFEALLASWSDLPYFDRFAQSLVSPGSVSPRPMPAPTSIPGVAHSAQTKAPSCDPNCGLEAATTVFAGQVFTNLMSLVEGYDLVANGYACTEQVSNLYTCVRASSCDRAALNDFFGSCSQALGSFAALAAAAGGTTVAAPWLVGALTAVGAVSGILSALNDDSVEKAVQECETFQEANCCIAQIPCASACCGNGFSCVAGSCQRNSSGGCAGGETPCGSYCCATGQLCQSGGCASPPTCMPPSFSCGGTCCSAGQVCNYGSCSYCNEGLCGGVECCSEGRFCNTVGQCLSEPEGGCGVICGTGCCPPGQYCDFGSCAGSAVVCGDSFCDPTHESPLSCPGDCPSQCGNHLCEAWETDSTCVSDCGTSCGDERCDPGESESCPQDCSVCGDLQCGPGETTGNCAGDCWCGNGTCDPGESPDCSDCGASCSCVSAATPTCCSDGTCCAPTQICCPAGCCDSGGTCPPAAPADCATCCPGDSCCPGNLYCCGDCNTGC